MTEAAEDPDQLEAPSARSLLLAVLTMHVVPDGGSVWTAALVDGLQRLGVTEKSGRQAILRLTGDGWLVTERHGRHTHLHLTAHAHEQMQRQQHIARFEAAPFDNEWVVLLLSIDNEGRESRRRLRRTLFSFGWGAISPGAWLTHGSSSQAAVLEVLQREGLDGSATFVRAEFLGPLPIEALVARTWDLRALGARYVAYLATFGAMEPTTDEEAFIARTRLAEMWIRSFRSDPFLPAAYLAPEWPGTAARHMLNDRMDRWVGPADRWWHEATRRAAP
jgi:phenylacetic acid degradation operon negative regulatory protein